MFRAKQHRHSVVHKDSKLIVSKETVKHMGAAIKLAVNKKWDFAPFVNFAKDLQFIEKNIGLSLIMGPKGVPETSGTHIIDRNAINHNSRTIPYVMEGTEMRLMVKNGMVKWHDIVFVTSSGARAVKEGHPIMIEIDKEGKIRKGLIIYGFADAIGSHILRTKRRKIGNGAAPPHIFGALR